MEAVLLSPLRRLVLESAVVSIGSASDNQLVVNGTKVSSYHAEMRVIEQGYSITDLASTNGTFVNAQQLTSNVPHPLNTGDIIRVGNTSFRYEASGVGQQASTPPPTPTPPTVPFGLGVKRILSSASQQPVAPVSVTPLAPVATSTVEQEYQSIPPAEVAPPAPVATASIPTSTVEQEYQSTPPADVTPPVPVATASIPTSTVEQEYQSTPLAEVAPPAPVATASIPTSTVEQEYQSTPPAPVATASIPTSTVEQEYQSTPPAEVAPPAIPSSIDAILLGSSGQTILAFTIVSIGSATENQVVVKDAKVSPHHAEMNLMEEGYSITDLASKNGTFVNEQRLASSVAHPLNAGDMIRVGDTHLKYIVNSPVASAPEPVAPPAVPSFTEAILLSPAGRTVLKSAVVSIGSAAENQVVVNDAKVSPHHAEMNLMEEGYNITDLASTKGTFVNAQRLASNVPHPLNTGDMIRVGDTDLRYLVGSSVPSAPPAPSAPSAPPAPSAPSAPSAPPAPSASSAPVVPSPIDAILLSPSGQTALTLTVVTIGLTSDNYVVVDDAKVSSHHAEMNLTEEGYNITDLASTNGTFVNAQQLASNVPHLLNAGDIIRIGNTPFRYEVSGVAQQAPLPASPAAPQQDVTPSPDVLDATGEQEHRSASLPVSPTYAAVPQQVTTSSPVASPDVPSYGPSAQPKRQSRWGLWVGLAVIAVVALTAILGFAVLATSH